jgi:hypothetical protein
MVHCERRRTTRQRVATDVYIDVDGERLRGRALDMSACGVLVAGLQAGLEAGRTVSLVFPVPVQGLIKLHRKRAVVAHVSKRGVGLRMASSGSAPGAGIA